MKRIICLCWLLGIYTVVQGQAQVRHKKLVCMVRSTTGIALSNASVYLVKARINSKSDSHGKVRMVYPLGSDTLVISCRGYATRKIVIPYDVYHWDVVLKPK